MFSSEKTVWARRIPTLLTVPPAPPALRCEAVVPARRDATWNLRPDPLCGHPRPEQRFIGASNLARLAEHPLFDGISRAELDRLDEDGRARAGVFAAGELILPRQRGPHDGVYFVLRGAVVVGEEPLGSWSVDAKLRLAPRAMLLRHLAVPAGGLFTDDYLDTPQPMLPIVVADGETELIRVTRQKLVRLLQRSSRGAERLALLEASSLQAVVTAIPVPQRPPARLRAQTGAVGGVDDLSDDAELDDDSGAWLLGPPSPGGTRRGRQARPRRPSGFFNLISGTLCVVAGLLGAVLWLSGSITASASASSIALPPTQPELAPPVVAEPIELAAAVPSAAVAVAPVAEPLPAVAPAAPTTSPAVVETPPTTSPAKRSARRSASRAQREVRRSVASCDEPEECLARARDLARDGDRARSLPLVRRALALAPRSAEVLAEVAGLYLEQHRYGSAALYFERAAALRPRHATYLLGGANAYLRADNAEQAARLFQQLLRLDPSHRGARRGLRKAVALAAN